MANQHQICDKVWAIQFYCLSELSVTLWHVDHLGSFSPMSTITFPDDVIAKVKTAKNPYRD